MMFHQGRILIAAVLALAFCALAPSAQASTQSSTTADVANATVLIDEPTSDLAAYSPAQLSALLDVSQEQVLAQLGVTPDSSLLPLGAIAQLTGDDPTAMVGQLPLDRLSTVDLGALAVTFGVSPGDVALKLGVSPSELQNFDPSAIDLQQLLDLLNVDLDSLLGVLNTATNTVTDRLSTVPVPGGTVIERVTDDKVRVVYVPASGNAAAARKPLAVSTRSLRRVRAGKRFTLKVKSSHAGVARITGKRVRKVSKRVRVGTTKVRVRAPKRRGLCVLKVRVTSADGQRQTKSVVLRVKRPRK